MASGEGQRQQGSESGGAGKGMRNKRLGGGGLCGRWSTASGGCGDSKAARATEEDAASGEAVPEGGCKGAMANGEGQRRQGSESDEGGRSKQRCCTRRRMQGQLEYMKKLNFLFSIV